MKDLRGRAALLTGAAGGIGAYLARAFAGEGMRLVLSDRPGVDLSGLVEELARAGATAIPLEADLLDRAARAQLVAEAERGLGPIDVLVNNAGVDLLAPFDVLTPEEIELSITLNVEAPLHLAMELLPGMLERRRGHLVQMASLAGKCPPAFQESYATTKAALIGFTQSIRASYAGTGVSASAVCPGFVSEAGIYARSLAESGIAAPPLLGTSTPDQVARAALRALREDLPEIIVTRSPVRPLLALGAALPRLLGAISARTGSNQFFRRVADFTLQQDQQARLPGPGDRS